MNNLWYILVIARVKFLSVPYNDTNASSSISWFNISSHTPIDISTLNYVQFPTLRKAERNAFACLNIIDILSFTVWLKRDLFFLDLSRTNVPRDACIVKIPSKQR